MDKRVQALITDMSQPLGYAVGNALAVMEASQTRRRRGGRSHQAFPGTGRAHESSGQERADAREAREEGAAGCWTVRLYRKFKQVVQARAATAIAGAVRTAAQRHRMREISTRARATSAGSTPEGIGRGLQLDRRGRDGKRTPSIRPWATILEVKVGERVDAGPCWPDLLHARKSGWRSGRDPRGAFFISAQRPRPGTDPRRRG